MNPVTDAINNITIPVDKNHVLVQYIVEQDRRIRQNVIKNRAFILAAVKCYNLVGEDLEDVKNRVCDMVHITNRRVGVLMACKDADNRIVIGLSRCSPEDPFDKDLALKIAVGRINSYAETKVFSYDSDWGRGWNGNMQKAFSNFLIRSAKYYKIPLSRALFYCKGVNFSTPPQW